MDPSLELLLRGAAAGVFVALAGVIAKAPISVPRLSGAIFSVAAAAHTMTQMAAWTALLGVTAPPVWALSVAAPGLFWAFVVTLFDDRKPSPVILALPSVALTVIGGVALALPSFAAIAWATHNVVAAALFLHALFFVWRGWRNDLVEIRRRLRRSILATAGLYGVAIVSVQLWELVEGPVDFLSPLGATLLCLLALASLLAFARPDGELFDPLQRGEQDLAVLPVDPGTGALARRLDAMMRIELAHRDENLSIGVLASRLDVQEYQLRRLINQHLGFRNFAAFLNRWRLEEAKLALRDPEQRQVPISTIAFDCGFGSLGPFNRAFKAETGVTPSAYRARSS